MAKRNLFVSAMLASSLVVFGPAWAQQPAQTSPSAPPKDLSLWLRDAYGGNHKFLARAAEKMGMAMVASSAVVAT